MLSPFAEIANVALLKRGGTGYDIENDDTFVNRVHSDRFRFVQ